MTPAAGVDERQQAAQADTAAVATHLLEFQQQQQQQHEDAVKGNEGVAVSNLKQEEAWVSMMTCDRLWCASFSMS